MVYHYLRLVHKILPPPPPLLSPGGWGLPHKGNGRQGWGGCSIEGVYHCPSEGQPCFHLCFEMCRGYMEWDIARWEGVGLPIVWKVGASATAPTALKPYMMSASLPKTYDVSWYIVCTNVIRLSKKSMYLVFIQCYKNWFCCVFHEMFPVVLFSV